MDVYEAIQTRIEIDEFADEDVDDSIIETVLDAARLAPSGRNLQHWRFILLDRSADLAELAQLSPSGGWVGGADFAVVVCTDPQYDFHAIDAGRTVTHMQLAAWDEGVGSRIFTVDRAEVLEFLEIPSDLDLTLVAGFGYPKREIKGTKSRAPLDEIVSHGRYGRHLD